jgi:cytochrome c2
MPASLRFTVGLIALGFIAAAVSLAVQKQQVTRADHAAAEALTGGHVQAGKVAIVRYGCGACHSIPGVPRADGETGPALAKIASRGFLAGKLPNTPEAMITWIRAPQSINPGGGMPDMGVTDRDGRDIAAYLYTLR